MKTALEFDHAHPLAVIVGEPNRADSAVHSPECHHVWNLTAHTGATGHANMRVFVDNLDWVQHQMDTYGFRRCQAHSACQALPLRDPKQ